MSHDWLSGYISGSLEVLVKGTEAASVEKSDGTHKAGTTKSAVNKREAAPKSATKVVAKPKRKTKRPRTDTREKLLDAAERLFSENGYDGTSLRDIATRAKLHLALSTYHFGTKEKLFEEVIGRRAIGMTEMRLKELDQIDFANLTREEAVRALILAYSMPMFRARYGSSAQWQAYVRLVSQLINVKRWVPLIRKHYDNCGRQFLSKFQEVLPDAEQDRLLDSFSFMISTMLYVCCYTNRFDRGSKVNANARVADGDIEAAIDNFVRFTHAGFMAL